MENSEEVAVPVRGQQKTPKNIDDSKETLPICADSLSSGANINVDENKNGPTDPIMKIPNEVWVLILSQLSQKELVQARKVWKKFREVIDSHFEFAVIVHDGKTNLNRVYELRIRDCLVTRLLTDVEIFQYPTLLRRIRFWGPINWTAFQRIMDETTGLEELSLTKFALMQDDLLLGDQRLNGFLKIKKLELLGYMCKEESRTVARNSALIFSYSMPDLEKLTVNFHCDITSINQIAVSFLDFVSKHNNRLQNLQVSLVPEANHPNESIASRTTTVVIPESVETLLRTVQLNMLRITTATKDLPIWTSLLNSQTRLQDLRLHLSEGGLMTVHTAYVVGIPFDMVKIPLFRNANTLTSVELKDLRLSPVVPGSLVDASPMDASVFRYASNMKRLILYRNSDDYRRYPQYPDQANIVNLKMLPASIEVLEVSRFYCRSDELQYIVDVLENLRSIVLHHTGSLSRLGVHGGIVESIASKPGIQTMNLTPLNYHNAEENKKYDMVKLKYQMNDGDQLYFDFERYRNGEPQPRPPSVILNPGVSSQDRCRPRGSPVSSSTFFHRRWASRIDNSCGLFRSRAAYSRRSRFQKEWYSKFRLPLPEFTLGRSSRSSQNARDNKDNNGKCCGTHDSLSGLFHSLDLHVTLEQRYLTETYENQPSTSCSFPISRCETDSSGRQRRWSGDEVLLDVLKKA